MPGYRYKVLMHPTTKLLANVTCLITRPKHQAHPLCELIEQAGGRCIIFPTLEIVTLPDIEDSIKKALDHANKIIFVSANAIPPVISHFPLHLNADIFAIGEGTQKALTHHHIHANIPDNSQFNSEGLLDSVALQAVTDQQIVIFSGKMGRRLLFDTLVNRGAHVQQIAVYERIKPATRFNELEDKTIDWIISASHEGLKNLWEMAGKIYQPWLCKQRILVISPAMKIFAEQLGFVYPALVSENASDRAVFKALVGAVNFSI